MNGGQKKLSMLHLIDSQIARHLDVSIVYLIDYCIVKLINLSGVLDFSSAFYDTPNEIDALRGVYRSSG